MNVEISKINGRLVPAWITNHFTNSLDSFERLLRIGEISQKGIAVITKVPALAKALKEEGAGTSDELISEIKKDAELAESEIKLGFPVLRSLIVIALWSQLEQSIKELVIEWIQNREDHIKSDLFKKLKVTLSEYLSFEGRDQAEYIVNLLEKEQSSALKRGIARFETMLEPISISGAVSEDMSKTFFEFQQIRNVIAHRNSICDLKLKTDCPWLDLSIGNPITISSQQLSSYANAIIEYLTIVFSRIRIDYESQGNGPSV